MPFVGRIGDWLERLGVVDAPGPVEPYAGPGVSDALRHLDYLHKFKWADSYPEAAFKDALQASNAFVRQQRETRRPSLIRDAEAQHRYVQTQVDLLRKRFTRLIAAYEAEEKEKRAKNERERQAAERQRLAAIEAKRQAEAQALARENLKKLYGEFRYNLAVGEGVTNEADILARFAAVTRSPTEAIAPPPAHPPT